jgi:hypothetical protein
MKFTFVVSQAGVVDAGLVGKVRVQDLCLLHYLRGWFTFAGAKIEVVHGRKFVWLHSEHAIEELPLLFNPQAKLTSRKNQLSAMIENLRETDLVETTRISKHHERPLPTVTKAAPIVTPPHDETVTPGQDRTVTSIRDEYLPANIDETGTRESGRKETPPVSPSEGEAESILFFWNSFSQLPTIKTITPNRARKIRKRLADRFWREHWRKGVQRAAACPFLTGDGRQGWRATLDWFLGGDSLAKILEGAYDNQPQPDQKPLPSDVKAQIKAVDELIAGHPANEDSCANSRHVTNEEHEDLRKLHRRRWELVRPLAGVPRTTRQPGDADCWWEDELKDVKGTLHGAVMLDDQTVAARLREIIKAREHTA